MQVAYLLAPVVERDWKNNGLKAVREGSDLLLVMDLKEDIVTGWCVVFVSDR